MSPGESLFLLIGSAVFILMIAGLLGMAWAAIFKLEAIESELKGLKTVANNQFISSKRFTGRCHRIIAISALISFSSLRRADPGANEAIQAMRVSLYRWVLYPFNMMELSAIGLLVLKLLSDYTTVFD